MKGKARRGGLRSIFSASVLAVVVAGCGGDGPKVVKITGTVTRGGQPVKDLVVNFVPETGRPSWGFTDPQGQYTLHYTKDQDGAVLGKHRVFVKYDPRDPEINLAITEGRFQYPPDIRAIEQKYGNLETTPLEFDVQKAQVIDLELD